MASKEAKNQIEIITKDAYTYGADVGTNVRGLVRANLGDGSLYFQWLKPDSL
jgi:hypothetical protein